MSGCGSEGPPRQGRDPVPCPCAEHLVEGLQQQQVRRRLQQQRPDAALGRGGRPLAASGGGGAIYRGLMV